MATAASITSMLTTMAGNNTGSAMHHGHISENDQEDCQIQPLDLSCPKQNATNSNNKHQNHHSPQNNLSDLDEEMSPIDHSIRRQDRTGSDRIGQESSVLHRPRSSSGNSDESDRDLSHDHNHSNHTSRFDNSRRSSTDQLVKAAALLRNYLPQAAQQAVSAAGLPPVLLDGPARKRFLTKYLHKNGERCFFLFMYILMCC